MMCVFYTHIDCALPSSCFGTCTGYLFTFILITK